MQLHSVTGYLNFLRRILIFSFILGIITIGTEFFAPTKYVTPALPWLIIFFLAVTLVGHYFILRSGNSKFIRFINAYLLVTIVKLFLFIGVIFLYLLHNRQDAAPFAIAFFILYLCYMIFEVIYLVSYFKPTSK